MRKIIRLFFIITVLLITYSSSHYVDATSYGTKASITFIESEDEATGKTDTSEAENIPGGDLIGESQAAKPVEKPLPKTTTNIYLLLLLGLVIVFIGVSFVLYPNLKKNKSNI